MKMKKSVFMIMATAALVSCSQNDLNEPVVNDGSQIALKSVAYSAGASTRAPFEGAIGKENVLTAFVPSSTGNSGSGEYNGSYLHTSGTMTFNSSSAATYDLTSLSDQAKSAFPVIGEQVYLFGAYPATGWTLNAKSADYTFTGAEDVMGAAEVLVTKTDVSAGDYKTLAFKHLLTKLEVKFKADGSATSAAGTIKSVKWVADDTATGNLKNKVTFTPAATETLSSFAVAGTPVAKLSFYGATETEKGKVYGKDTYLGQTYELTATSTLQAYAMVTPVVASTATEAEYFLEVIRQVEGSDVTDYISFDLMRTDNKTPFTGSTAGNAFTVVVNYTKDDIKAVATVTDWVENGEYIAEKPVN